MVYQIEEDNGGQKQQSQPLFVEKISELGDGISSLRGISDLNVLASVEMHSDVGGLQDKDRLAGQLDDLYSALIIEQGVVQTDYSHQFKDQKVQ